MIRSFPMSALPTTPEGRREQLLGIKRAAKKAGFPVKIWLDAQGLHVEGAVAMLKAVSAQLPQGLH